jgi:hypothetical protein
MKVLAVIILIWLLFLFVGSVFGILGKLIWIAVLATVIAAVWGYLKKDPP